MRMRAALAAASGTLALSALALPVAHADGNPHIDRVVVNGGKDVVVGNEDSTFTVSITVTDPTGAFNEGPIDAYLWHGTAKGTDGVLGGIAPEAPVCEYPGATTMTCVITDYAYAGDLHDSIAGGSWHVAVNAAGVSDAMAATARVKREARLTADVSPVHGRIHATGDLTRADWDRNRFAGYAGRHVRLQFRKAGKTTYSTVKSIRAGRTGGLDTTVKTSADGYWRWYFPGDSTTGAATTADVYVHVR